jgi:hypothetical protein
MCTCILILIGKLSEDKNKSLLLPLHQKCSEYTGNRLNIPEIEFYFVNKVKIFHFPKKTDVHCWKIYLPSRSGVSATTLNPTDLLLAMASGRVALYMSAYFTLGKVHTAYHMRIIQKYKFVTPWKCHKYVPSLKKYSSRNKMLPQY